MNKHNKVEEVQPRQAQPFIQYFSTFDELTAPIRNYEQLQSGVMVTELFLLIKQFKLEQVCEDHAKTFSHKFSNFKSLLHSIEQYYNNRLNCEIDSSQIDIVEICQSGCQQELDKLFQLFVKTAAQSQNKGFFIEKILKTSRATQEFLKSIVEKTIQPELKQSPRKEKEKRMIDHMIELDHQNQKLQQIIGQMEDEKYQVQMKLKSQSEELSEKNNQIMRLRSCLNDEEVNTPQKRRSIHIPDTSDRKDSQIDSLKRQILEINTHHELEMQHSFRQIEKLSEKVVQFDKIKSQLEFSLEIIENNRLVIAEAQTLQISLSQCKAEMMNKDNVIKYAQEQLQKYESRFLEMQRVEMQLRGELQRKNVQLIELASKIQRSSPKKVDHHHNLFLQFPDIVNTEADAFIETNKTLRDELERSRLSLQSTAYQLEQAQLRLEELGKADQQNKKLRELLIIEKAYKGEQIDVLMHALYHLRRKVRPSKQDGPRVLKSKNR